MTENNPSSTYFNQVAPQWDSLRSGYFTEAVRDSAIAKAYLRADMVVADIGAGTGFMSAGLAPLVRRVYAVDGSEAMLAVAQKNLAAFNNIEFHPADGLALPLPDDSLDAVFANMYLHHCPDPLAAIHEMVRILRPGGRLVITDMDAHPYAWLKEEMADVWQGFERPQVLDWYEQAGLVNRIIDCTGQSCCAESQDAARDDRQAKISVFVAVGTKRVPGVTEVVKADYGAQARRSSAETGSSCCSSASSGAVSDQDLSFLKIKGYSEGEQGEIPAEAAEISLGCGNPTAIANMKPGEVVVDIGSGGGIDAFIAANRVGKTGKVIGVDMTPAMLERARRTAQRNGYSQVEFREGIAEQLPVESATVDVVLSNCVINLTQDKGKVFAEAYRVLKADGRLEVSDIVSDISMPGDLREDGAAWAGCVSGALPEGEYIDLLKQAGFGDIAIRRSYVSGEVIGTQLYSDQVSARKGEGLSQTVTITEGGVVKSSSSSCGCG